MYCTRKIKKMYEVTIIIRGSILLKTESYFESIKLKYKVYLFLI